MVGNTQYWRCALEQQLTFFLALAVGLIFGGLAIWLMLRTDTNSAYARARSEVVAEQTALTERLSGKEVRIEDLARERDQLKAELAKLREENNGLKAASVELQTKLDESEDAAEEKLAFLSQSQERLSEAFKAVSAEALQSNNQTFLGLARATLQKLHEEGPGDAAGNHGRVIDEIVKPLKETLGKVETNIKEMEKARVADYTGISEQVKSLMAAQDLMRAEASSLVSALRGPAVHGRWGEVQLRRVVEMAGMAPYCDFEEQTPAGADGDRSRPDMLVRLPNQREVVVDTKVSLKAYMEAMEAHDEQTRVAKLSEHAAEVRAHLQKLGSKEYWDQFHSPPEFVVAFLPAEAFFGAALEQDSGLIEFGVQHRVILATPTTLIALLKAVAYGWRQEQLTQNAQEISDLGKTLYHRLQAFSKSMEDVQCNLQRTVEGYNKAVGTLESTVLASARKFEDLGAAAKAEIPCPEPVDTFPRSLQAVGRAVSSEIAEGEDAAEPPAAEAAEFPVEPEPAEVAEYPNSWQPPEADEPQTAEAVTVTAEAGQPEIEAPAAEFEVVEVAIPANRPEPSESPESVEVSELIEQPNTAEERKPSEAPAERQDSEEPPTISYDSFVKTT